MVQTPTTSPNEFYDIRSLKGFAAAQTGNDFATAIEDAAANAVAKNQTLLLSRRVKTPGYDQGKYPVSRRTIIPGTCNVHMSVGSQILGLNGVGHDAILEIGSPVLRSYDQRVRVAVSRLTLATDWTQTGSADWTTRSNCSVRIYNPANGEFWIDEAARSAVGLEVIGYGDGTGARGIAYNTFNLGKITDNGYGLRIHTVSLAGEQAWVNENTFAKGNFQQSTGTRTALGDLTPVAIWQSGNGNNQNANIFWQPNIEIASTSPYFTTVWPWRISTGAIGNLCWFARHENRPTHLAFLRLDASISSAVTAYTPSIDGNKAVISYAANQLTHNPQDLLSDESQKWPGNEVTVMHNDVYRWPYSRGGWHSGKIANRALQYNSAGNVMVQGFDFVDSGGTRRAYSFDANHVITGDHLQLAGDCFEGLFTTVDVRKCKHFAVVAESVQATATFRICVKTYDSGKAALWNAGGTPRYASLTPGGVPQTGWGNSYYIGTNSTETAIVKILRDDDAAAAVEWAEVGIIQIGSTPTKLRSIQLISLDGQPISAGPWDARADQDAYRVASKPVTGSWKGNVYPGMLAVLDTIASHHSPVAYRYVSNSDGWTVLDGGVIRYGLSIASPGASEDRTLGEARAAFAISSMRAVLVGSATPSVTWTVRKGSDRSAAGTEVVTGGTTTTSITSGSAVTILTSPAVAANDFLWLETTAQSGTVGELHVTVHGYLN